MIDFIIVAGESDIIHVAPSHFTLEMRTRAAFSWSHEDCARGVMLIVSAVLGEKERGRWKKWKEAGKYGLTFEDVT